MSFRYFAVISCLFSTLFLAGQAAFADELGRVSLDGRTVIISADGTWRYAETDDVSLAEGCNLIEGVVRFCAPNDSYQILPQNSPPFSAIYQVDDPSLTHYVGFVVEKLGRQQGLNANAVKKIVLAQAATAMNTSPENILVRDERTIDMSGREFLSFAYEVKVENLEVSFINNIHVSETHTFQITVWAIGYGHHEKLNRMTEIALRNSLIDG